MFERCAFKGTKKKKKRGKQARTEAVTSFFPDMVPKVRLFYFSTKKVLLQGNLVVTTGGCHRFYLQAKMQKSYLG